MPVDPTHADVRQQKRLSLAAYLAVVLNAARFGMSALADLMRNKIIESSLHNEK